MTEQERLKAFEQILCAVQRQYEECVSNMERLKAQGKVKTATYRQIMGNKMMYQGMLSMYRVYGLLEDDT